MKTLPRAQVILPIFWNWTLKNIHGHSTLTKQYWYMSVSGPGVSVLWSGLPPLGPEGHDAVHPLQEARPHHLRPWSLRGEGTRHLPSLVIPKCCTYSTGVRIVNVKTSVMDPDPYSGSVFRRFLQWFLIFFCLQIWKHKPGSGFKLGQNSMYLDPNSTYLDPQHWLTQYI